MISFDIVAALQITCAEELSLSLSSLIRGQQPSRKGQRCLRVRLAFARRLLACHTTEVPEPDQTLVEPPSSPSLRSNHNSSDYT